MSKSFKLGHVIQVEGNTVAVALNDGKIALMFRDLDKGKIAKNLKLNEEVKVYIKSTMFGNVYSRIMRVK